MNYNNIIMTLIIILVILVLVGIFVFGPFMSKTDSIISITSSNELTDGNEFIISLTDVNGNPLAKQTVYIAFIDVNGVPSQKEITTDDTGNGVIVLSGLASGQYTVNASYRGNDDYSASSTSQQLTIQEKVVQVQSNNNDDENYYHGYSRSDFSPGQQAAIDEARAHGYDSPAEYRQATM